MEYVLEFIGLVIFAIWLVWGGFLMMMPLKRNYEAGFLNSWNKIFGYPWLALFILMDFLFNITFGTVFFLDIPRDFLFTQRLERYLNTKCAKWRHDLAYYFCTRFLDPFEDGGHCKRK